MKKLILITLILSFGLTVQAQKSNFWKKFNESLTVTKKIDTVYIYHPKQSFILGIFTTMQQVGFDVRVKFKLNLDESISLPGVSTYSLNEKLSFKLGLELGYGKICFGYGMEVNPQKNHKKKSFALNILGKAWGIHFSYFNLKNQFKSGISVVNEDNGQYIQDEIINTDPATLKTFTIDGYYVFNNKRFVYPASYKACLVQRRTAGSWMLTARYFQGRLTNTPEASLDSYNLLDCFFTIQASIGGGYSGNIVCWHKDPKGQRDKGLRNITINLTAMPVITFVDYLRTTAYTYDEEGVHIGEKVSKMFCYPMPNVMGSAAIGITLDRFLISTQIAYNWFFFLSTNAYNRKNAQMYEYMDDFKYRGSFHDWTMKVLFMYKF